MNPDETQASLIAAAVQRLEEAFDWIDTAHDWNDLEVLAHVALGIDVPPDLRERSVGLGWK